jgi:hypothetical protein
MSNVDRRLDRIEKLLGAPGCTCSDDDAVSILVVQDGWGEAASSRRGIT